MDCPWCGEWAGSVDEDGYCNCCGRSVRDVGRAVWDEDAVQAAVERVVRTIPPAAPRVRLVYEVDGRPLVVREVGRPGQYWNAGVVRGHAPVGWTGQVWMLRIER